MICQNGHLDHFGPFWSSTLSDSTTATQYNWKIRGVERLEKFQFSVLAVPRGSGLVCEFQYSFFTERDSAGSSFGS